MSSSEAEVLGLLRQWLLEATSWSRRLVIWGMFVVGGASISVAWDPGELWGLSKGLALVVGLTLVVSAALQDWRGWSSLRRMVEEAELGRGQ